MRSNSLGEKLLSHYVKEGPQKEAWWKEEVKFEIERLKAVLRDPRLTEEERAIAQSQIANYEETTGIAVRPSADWLDQIYLLAS
jgi:hypothetical protein